MRIHIISDLHLEFGDREFYPAAAEVTIIAGDLHTKQNGFAWIRENLSDRPVLYVLGNHEYYGEKFPGLVNKMRSAAGSSNVTILENESVEINEFRFFGCTLWTDLNLFGDPLAGCTAALDMNDYKRIRHSQSFKKLRPQDTRMQHFESLRKLTAFLESGDPRKSVVVTHHAPSAKSLMERRKKELISCAYASNLEELIVKYEPLLWIHGHIHNSSDYYIGRTRVVANPCSYPSDLNEDFKADFTVNLSEEIELVPVSAVECL